VMDTIETLGEVNGIHNNKWIILERPVIVWRRCIDAVIDALS